MKIKLSPFVFPFALVAVTIATAALIGFVARATETNSPPSPDTARMSAMRHRSIVEDISGQNSPAGRFQLVSGKSFMAEGPNSAMVDVMVKIDTQTGRTWMLVLVGTTNQQTMGFMELKDLDRK